MTVGIPEILAGLAAMLGAGGGVGGLVLWRRSRIDVAAALERHWQAAIEREARLIAQLVELRSTLGRHRQEAADRERELLERVGQLSAQLEAHRRMAQSREEQLTEQISALRRELGTTAAHVDQVADNVADAVEQITDH